MWTAGGEVGLTSGTRNVRRCVTVIGGQRARVITYEDRHAYYVAATLTLDPHTELWFDAISETADAYERALGVLHTVR